jgi:hypothetical protein
MLQVFGRRLAVFWASIFLAVFTVFQYYVVTYHNEILSAEVPQGSDGSDAGGSSRRSLLQTSTASPDASAAPCGAQSNNPLIVLMAILALYVVFHTALTLLSGITFSHRSIDEATYRPGARASRLSLLQQTSFFWEFRKRILEAKDKHAHNAMVTDGLCSTLASIITESVDSSTIDVMDASAGQDCKTSALPFYVNLLNVGIILFIFVAFLFTIRYADLNPSKNRPQTHLSLRSISSILSLGIKVM